MRITYDKSVDAAYIYLKNIGPGEVDQTHICNTELSAGTISLDFDKQGILLGIEILEAGKTLPKEILDRAEIIG